MRDQQVISRRRFLKLSLVGAAGTALLAACGPGAPAPTATPAPAKPAAVQPAATAPAVAVATPAGQPKPSAGETTLVYWTFMPTEQRFPARATLFPQWGAKRNAKIQIEDVAAGTPFQQKMAAAFAAKLLPDLLDPWDSTALINFAAQGFVVEVDDVLRESGKEDFFPVGVTFGTYKGKLYGMPLLGFPHLMHYRKDWFEQEGIKPPTDWAELFEVCQKLHGKTKDGNQIAAMSGYFASVHAPPFFQNMVGPNNGFTFDKDGKVVINSKEVREAMENVKRLTPYFQPGYVNMDYGTTRTQFVEGKIAIEMDSTSMANIIVKSKPEMGPKITSVLLPFGPSSKKDRSGYNGLSYFAVGSQSKSPDLARDFLKWFYSPAIYLEAYKSYDWGLIPERHAVADNPEWHKALPEAARPIVLAGVKAAEIATFPGQDWGPNPIGGKLQAEDIYRNLLQKVAAGTESVDAALKWAEGEITRIVKEA